MAEIIDQNKPSGYVFKVLSGSMNGIEFSLGSHAYFMCVSESPNDQQNLARNVELSERTLYLPTPNAGHNFVVNLAGQVTEQEFIVTINFPDRQETRSLAFNTICQVEGIYFALKHEGEAWSPVVEKGVLPATIVAEPETLVSKSVVRSSGRKYKWIIAAFLALSLGGIGGAAALFKYGAKSGTETAKTMLQQLGNNAGYSAQLGRDNTYYLFAQNNQLAEWARRSLAREESSESWKVLTPAEEEARLTRILDRHNITFFTIRLNDIHAPTLVMSSTRYATDEITQTHIKKMLLDVLPYADKVNIELKSDEDILRMAEEGLVALGFDYQMTQSGSGVTLSTPMPAGDARIAELERFVSQYYRLWGRRFVHFSIELRDDAMKGKSFKYGDNGYVNIGKSHWAFQ